MKLRPALTKIILIGNILILSTAAYFYGSYYCCGFKDQEIHIQCEAFQGQVEITSTLSNSSILPSLVFLKLHSEQLQVSRIKSMQTDINRMVSLNQAATYVFGSLREPREGWMVFPVVVPPRDEMKVRIRYERVLANRLTPPRLSWWNRNPETPIDIKIEWDPRYEKINQANTNQKPAYETASQTDYEMASDSKYPPRYEWKYRKVVPILNYVG